MSKNLDFKFTVSTTLGARPEVLRKLAKQFSIEPSYRLKWKKSFWISNLVSILAKLDRYRWRKVKKTVVHDTSPIFIIGHWRSGTTYLHDLLCTDPDAGFTTTYQTVFPNNLFAFQRILKFFMAIFLPSARPGDGLPLRTDQPQEEEFAIGSEIDYCFYYWMYFPKDASYFRATHFNADSIPEKKARQWKENYKRFVQRALCNTKGRVFISKNPPNTARIKWILELYPTAKFVFIQRNPYEVYRSSLKFFRGVIPPLQFQDLDEKQFEEHILESYVALHYAYFNQRMLIPQGNLIEVAYEDLIKNPLQIIHQLVARFAFPSAEVMENRIKAKIQSAKAHQADDYVLDAATIEKINARWGAIFTQLGYALKENPVT